MKKICALLLGLLFLHTFSHAYQLRPEIIEKKRNQLELVLKKRTALRGLLHLVAIGTLANEVVQWCEIIFGEDTSSLTIKIQTDWLNQIKNSFYRPKTWQKVGSYALRIGSLYVIKRICHHAEESILEVELIDWCINTFAPYEKIIRQIQLHAQENTPEYNGQMIKHNMYILFEQWEYLIAYLNIKAENSSYKKIYHQMSAYLFKLINSTFSEITITNCDILLEKLEHVQKVLSRELDQLRIIQGTQKEHMLLTRLMSI